MILKTFTVLALVFILSGCQSYRYMGSTDAQFKDSTRAERNVALQVNHISGVPSVFDLKRELKVALIKEGFDELHFGKDYQGYSIEVNVTTGKWEETPGFIALFMFSIMILPSRIEHTETFDVSYYNNGNLMRSSNYQIKSFEYYSLLSPIGSFWADSHEEAIRKMAKDLAKNIALDFPVTEH